MVLAVPDSRLAPLCDRVRSGSEIEYVQCVDEATCVGVAAGLGLSGTRALVIMENSGLRSAAETLARLHLSHRIFTCVLLSHRGAFGERNWWGQAHSETMVPLLELLDFKWQRVYNPALLSDHLRKAYQVLDAGQCGAALVAEPEFLDQLT